MLIAENGDYQVHHLEGPDARLLITFSHMDYFKGGSTFWGDRACNQIGIAAIGVVSKSNSWYPPDPLIALMERIIAVRNQYAHATTYGFSMGGYAAIKFSALMQSNTTLALSPQYAISPVDVLPHDNRLTKHFSPQGGGLPIVEQDVSGRVIIGVDPFHKIDQWNADQIKTAAGNCSVRCLSLPFVGHETIDVLANTEVLRASLDFLAEEKTDDLHRLLLERRRALSRRTYGVLRAAIERGSGLLPAAAIKKIAHTLPPAWHSSIIQQLDKSSGHI